MKTFQIGFACLFLIFFFGDVIAKDNPQQTRHTKAVYVLNYKIDINGHTKATPQIYALVGQEVNLTIGNGTGYGGVRITSEIKDALTNDKNEQALQIDLLIHKEVGGQWMLVGEPKIFPLLGKEAELEVHGATSSYSIAVNAKQMDKISAMKILTNTKPSDCSTEKNPENPINMMMKECCSTSCGDGSGNTLKCCGAIQCCACGSCCSP